MTNLSDLFLTSNSPPKSGDTLVHDTFIDSDGVDIAVHIPDTMDLYGGTWISDAGTPTILDNTLEENANLTAIMGVVSGESDVIITMTGRVSRISADYGITGAAVRILDVNNYIACIPKAIGGDPWTWGIYSIIAGSQVERASGVGSSGGAQTLSIDYIVTLDGDNIRMEVPSQGIDINWDSSTFQTVTRHGIRMVNLSSPPVSQRANCSEFKVIKL